MKYKAKQSKRSFSTKAQAVASMSTYDTDSILCISTRKLLWVEITEMLVAV